VDEWLGTYIHTRVTESAYLGGHPRTHLGHGARALGHTDVADDWYWYAETKTDVVSVTLTRYSPCGNFAVL